MYSSIVSGSFGLSACNRHVFLTRISRLAKEDWSYFDAIYYSLVTML